MKFESYIELVCVRERRLWYNRNILGPIDGKHLYYNDGLWVTSALHSLYRYLQGISPMRVRPISETIQSTNTAIDKNRQHCNVQLEDRNNPQHIKRWDKSRKPNADTIKWTTSQSYCTTKGYNEE